jgi:hypothetical protein
MIEQYPGNEKESEQPTSEFPVVRNNPRPRSVLIAGILSILFVAAGIQPLTYEISLPRLLPFIFACLISIGLFRGHRLAWQWASLVGGVTGALTAVYALMSISVPFPFPLFYFSAAAIPLTITVLLSVRSSKVYFGLICPSCDSTNTLPVDFLYTKQRCRKCRMTF